MVNLNILSLMNMLTKRPFPVIKTYLGHVSYSPKLLSEEIKDPYICQIELSEIIRRDFQEINIKDLFKMPENQINILSLRHMDYGLPLTTGESEIAFDSSAGRRKTTLGEVIERYGSELPQCVIVPAIEVPFESTHRKCMKAQEKTLSWFKQCHTASSTWKEEVTLFGVAIPHSFRPHQMPLDIDKELSSTLVNEHISSAYGYFAKKLIDLGATGVVVGGAGTGESVEKLAAAVHGVKTAVGLQVPVLVQGMDSLQEILVCMKAGADMISSNLPQIMTHGFLAMDWTSPNLAHSDLVPASEEPTQTSRKRSISDVIDQNDSKIDSSVQSVVEPSTVATSALETDFSKKLNQNAMRSLPNEDEKDQKEHRDSFQKNAITARLKMKRSLYSNYCIDMADTRFARDTEPLVAGCQCHACRYHTRAYIHHLIKAREILGEVLLYTHNQHQLLRVYSTGCDILHPGTDNDSLPVDDTVEYETWIDSLLTKFSS